MSTRFPTTKIAQHRDDVRFDLRCLKFAAAIVLAGAIGFPQLAEAATQLNGWQKTVTAMARDLTAGLDAGSGFSVEYNSLFSDIDYAVVLAPGPGGKLSSMNIIAKCPYSRADVIATPGGDVADFSTTGAFKFGANASAPPDFATGALANAKAGLNLDRKRDVAYAFRDISLEQLSEDAARTAVNSASCMSKLGRRTRVFVVRGRYVMRLLMQQTKETGVDLNADLSFKSTQDPAKVGFEVSWKSKDTWSIRQKTARPWFRVVGLMVKGPDGKFDYPLQKGDQ